MKKNFIFCKSITVKNRCSRDRDAELHAAAKNALYIYLFFHVLLGDGANDVSMIQMADVGIGISGQEGMQVMTTVCLVHSDSTPTIMTQVEKKL